MHCLQISDLDDVECTPDPAHVKAVLVPIHGHTELYRYMYACIQPECTSSARNMQDAFAIACSLSRQLASGHPCLPNTSARFAAAY